VTISRQREKHVKRPRVERVGVLSAGWGVVPGEPVRTARGWARHSLSLSLSLSVSGLTYLFRPQLFFFSSSHKISLEWGIVF
jgi:hypothetical protein